MEKKTYHISCAGYEHPQTITSINIEDFYSHLEESGHCMTLYIYFCHCCKKDVNMTINCPSLRNLKKYDLKTDRYAKMVTDRVMKYNLQYCHNCAKEMETIENDLKEPGFD
jgi:hypothetical protein